MAAGRRIVFIFSCSETAHAADEDLRIVAPGSKILHRKIIVTGEDVKFYEGKDEPIPGPGKVVAPFAIYHKLKPTKDSKEEYLKVGTDTYIRVGAVRW